jgi:hypothetical protein
MATETVKIYCVDENTDALAGVLVRAYTYPADVFVTQATSAVVGSDAIAELTLSGAASPGTSYTIRMSKTGVAYDGGLGNDSYSPQLIAIYSPAASSPTGTNDFTVQGQTFTLPTATDARLCRCSGFFKDGTGAALANLDLTVTPKFKPTVVDGFGVMGSRLDARTDDDGYAVFDLYRNGLYNIVVQSVHTGHVDDPSATRLVSVPDQASVNLVYLLFPIISSLTWAPTSAALSVGATATITITVVTSDGRTLTGTACEDVTYTSSDTTVAAVVATETELTITGIGAGSATITATRTDQTIVSIPDSGISNGTFSVTVT